jgi:hypothetical protein
MWCHHNSDSFHRIISKTWVQCWDVESRIIKWKDVEGQNVEFKNGKQMPI